MVNGGFCTADTTVGLVLLAGSGDLQNPVTSPALCEKQLFSGK